MRTRLLILLAATLLAGCLGNPSRPGEPARFDLGPVPAGTGVAGLAAIEVTAPSWLADRAMQYRLLYAEPARRQAYAESRWAAPPAELLHQALERRLAGAGTGHCRLRIELDEFAQVFDSPGASRLVLEGRATLFASPEPVARRSFALAPAAATPDARGGVAAAAAAAAGLAAELERWLAQASPEACRAP